MRRIFSIVFLLLAIFPHTFATGIGGDEDDKLFYPSTPEGNINDLVQSARQDMQIVDIINKISSPESIVNDSKQIKIPFIPNFEINVPAGGVLPLGGARGVRAGSGRNLSASLNYNENTTTQTSGKSEASSYFLGQQRKLPTLTPSTIMNTMPENQASISENPSEVITGAEEKIIAIRDYIIEHERFIERLDSLALIELPIGIKKNIGNQTYIIAIDSIALIPEGARLNASMAFTTPGGEVICFAATDIAFLYEGGFQGDVKLSLVTDKTVLKNDQMELTIIGTNQLSYVEFNCEGFESMSVEALITLDKDKFIPENPDGSPGEGEVTATFTTTLYDWNDLIVDISLMPFQVEGLPGVGFYVSNAVFDFSDYANSSAVVFPDEYYSSQLLPDNPDLWRGFYLRELSIKMPPEFKNMNEPGVRREFAAYEMLIDNHGFSGRLVAEYLLNLGDGDMNRWTYSVEHLEVKLVANQFKTACFSGKMNIPVLKDNSSLSYSALIIRGGSYQFNVSCDSNVEMSIWAADVILYPSSFIEVSMGNGEFIPAATLHGNMNIKAGYDKNSPASNENKGVTLAEIGFEGLRISSVQPYIQTGTFSFGTELAPPQLLAGFPITIEDIYSEQRPDDEVGLHFTMILNLVDEKDGGFGADGSFTLVGKMDQGSVIHRWKYEALEVHEAGIDIYNGAFTLQGRIYFFREDPVYGTGFQGTIMAEFKPKIKLDAMAIFGKVDSYRYWSADAMAHFSRGIPIFTGVAIYGFGGGAYYHMKQAGYSPGGSGIGVSTSGTIYRPDKNTYLGLKASVCIGTNPKEDAFNGDATFEMSFNSRGGLKNITFTGNAAIMTPPNEDKIALLKDKVSKLNGSGAQDALPTTGARGQIAAQVYLAYDFDNDILHGNFKVYVNVAGGIVRGTGANNLAGEAVVHFEKNDWYIYIGTPNNPVGIKLMSVVQATSYFMVGTKILPSPPPPSNVSDILGGMDLDYMKNENEIGNGSGFAFGARFEVNTGDLTFLMFYGSFKAGAGFDVMIKNYGPDVHCKGRTDALGINGWYANGQVYAYLEGKIGIKVTLFGDEKKVEILSLAAAAILQAKMPNPTWMRGAVGGEYSVLNGVVKGKCHFEFEIGEQCEIVGGSPLSGMATIAEVTPADGDKDVSVFTAAQAVFNIPIDKSFEMKDISGQMKTFRARLEYLKIMDGSVQIAGKYEWNVDKTVLAFDSDDLLPGKKNLGVMAKVYFEEKTGGNWQAVLVNGAKYTEELKATFTTGVAPDYIPLTNVAYSYPIINQFNYYPGESSMGYIQLKKGQDELFLANSEWEQKGRFVTGTNEYYYTYTYDNSSNTVNFTRPSGIINDRIYRFELVNIPKNQLVVDENVEDVETDIVTGDDANELTITTQDAEGTVQALEVKSIYTSYFRCSKYPSLKAKLANYTYGQGYPYPLRTNVELMSMYMEHDEHFDMFEILGDPASSIKPLIRVEAITSSTSWYTTYIHPMIYQKCPIEPGITITNRDTAILGFPPYRAAYIDQKGYDYKVLTSAEIESNLAGAICPAAWFRYYLSSYMDYDMHDLQDKIANKYRGAPITNSDVLRLFNGDMKLFTYDNYPLKLIYILPGINSIANTTQIFIHFYPTHY